MWMCSYTTFEIKVDLCAHTDSKNGIFTRRVYSACIFDSYPLPLFRRLTVGAAIEKNFFWFLFFRFRYRTRFDCYFDSRFILVWFWFRIYFISFTIFDSDYNYGFCVFSILYFDSFLLVEFYLHQFRLVSALQILHFDSSTLYLFCLL